MNRVVRFHETIELRDDYGNPFYIPNSAVVSLELTLTY